MGGPAECIGKIAAGNRAQVADSSLLIAGLPCQPFIMESEVSDSIFFVPKFKWI